MKASAYPRDSEPLRKRRDKHELCPPLQSFMSRLERDVEVLADCVTSLEPEGDGREVDSVGPRIRKAGDGEASATPGCRLGSGKLSRDRPWLKQINASFLFLFPGTL